MKKYVVRWTNWRTKITHTTSLQKKLVCTATIGGSVRILLVPTRCQSGIELISQKHYLLCDTSKTKRIMFITKICKALLRLGGTRKIPGGILQSITTKTDPALIDQGNLLKSDLSNYSWNDSQNLFDAELQCYSVTANSSLLSPTRSVNTIPLNTEKWLRKSYVKIMVRYMTLRTSVR